MNSKLPQSEFREGGPSKNGNMKKELPAVRKCLQQVDPTSIRRLLPIFFIYPLKNKGICGNICKKKQTRK